MVYSHPLYGRVPTALLTGRKQFPFHETIKIKLSVNSTKVTACNLITPEMRAVNPVMYHPTHTGLYAASHRSHCQNTAEMHSLLVFRCFLVVIAALPAMESQVFIPFWDAPQKLARWHQISPSMLLPICAVTSVRSLQHSLLTRDTLRLSWRELSEIVKLTNLYLWLSQSQRPIFPLASVKF